jgi:hypothetical protein
MTTHRRSLAVLELALISPASLFMTALFLRELQPIQYEPAHTAQRVVTWFAERPRLGLGVLLIALPLCALVTGCAVLLRGWSEDVELRRASREALAAVRAHLAMLFVALATLTAAGILAIVAVHALTD